MAIVDYYNAALAIDQAGRLVRDAKARVYALADTTFSNPLPITDLQGIPMALLETNAEGIYPPFRVATGEMQVVVKSGPALTPITSLAVYANAAEAAASMASGSAGAADMSADAAALSASTAVAARDAAVAVGNTNDTIIEGRIKATGSKTELALRDKIVPVAEGAAAEYLASEPGVVAAATAAVDGAIDGAAILRAEEVELTGPDWLGWFDPDDTTRQHPLGGAVHDSSAGWDWVAAAEQTEGGPRTLRGGIRDANGGRSTFEDAFGTRLTATQDMYVKGDSIARAWGDELGADLALLGYPGKVHNYSVGGENTPTIIGRTGGSAWLAVVADGVIPTSGSVNVTLTDEYGATDATGSVPRIAPLIQSAQGVNPVTLFGDDGTPVRGILYPTGVPASPHAFRRLKEGAAVPTAWPTPVRTWASTNTMHGIQIIATGQNDDGTVMNFTRRFDMIDKLLARTRAAKRRFLVLTAFSGGPSTRSAEEAEAVRRYGRHAILVRPLLSSRAALAVVGVTPTTADTDAITAGNVPPSFFPTDDPVHPNLAGRRAIRRLVINRLSELEYI